MIEGDERTRKIKEERKRKTGNDCKTMYVWDCLFLLVKKLKKMKESRGGERGEGAYVNGVIELGGGCAG